MASYKVRLGNLNKGGDILSEEGLFKSRLIPEYSLSNERI